MLNSDFLSSVLGQIEIHGIKAMLSESELKQINYRNIGNLLSFLSKEASYPGDDNSKEV